MSVGTNQIGTRKKVLLELEPGLFVRLRDCAAAIPGGSRQEIIRIALDAKLTELEDRLARGERIVLKRKVGELVLVE